MKTSTSVVIREVEPLDIESVVDYWFDPGNRDYHLGRGTDPVLWLDPKREAAAFEKIMSTPLTDRVNAAAIITVDGKACGHVLLNNVYEDTKGRMHFHAWRHRLERRSLGDTLSLTKQFAKASVEYFFDRYPIEQIVGDVAVTNRTANFVLASMGVKVSEVVSESYLGQEQLYNRFVFQKDGRDHR